MIDVAALTGGLVLLVQRPDELRAAFATVVSQFRSGIVGPTGLEVSRAHAGTVPAAG